jgi:pimeloyl-ACP methyl ester carboxylesterase
VRLGHYETILFDDVEPGSYGQFQQSSGRPLKIFVHGFLGGSRDTWGRFPVYASIYKDGDNIYYQYKSFRNSIVSNAEDLLSFLIALEARGDLRTEKYAHLILIGHSEGAVVLRQALLLMKDRNLPASLFLFLLNARVRLFAPAHFGFSPTGLFGLLFYLGLANTARACLRFSRGYVEMHERTLLMNIQSQTERLQTQGLKGCYVARAVFGRHEDIVVRAVYHSDIEEKEQPGEDHTTICKPRSDYGFPITFVHS